MHQTTYGYNIMDSGDPAKGTTGWFAGVNANFTRLDAHSHNGVNSVSLAITSIAGLTSTVLAANWIATDRGDGGYMQTVSVAAGIDDIANYAPSFLCTAPGGVVGQRAYPDYVRVTASTFKVYCIDNTAAFTVLYR